MRHRGGLVRTSFVAALFAIFFAQAAHAVIRVRVWTGGSFEQDDYPPSSNITILTAPATTQINVWSTTSNEDIGVLTVAGSGTGAVQMVIGAGAFNFTTAIGVGACNNLGGIATARQNVGLYGRIKGNLTGAVEVDQLWRFAVDGSIQKNISSIGGAFFIDAGSVASGANLVQLSGSMGQIACAGTLGGSLNSSGGVSTLGTGTLSGSVIASGTIGSLNVTASLTGALSAARLNNALIVGDLSGDVSVASGLLSGDVLLVGGSLSSTGSITMPASGLGGQITINNANSTGTWSGVVTVGTTNLTAAGYTDTASSLGGGAVGLAPFGLHDESCSPVNGGSVGAQSSGPFSARHYGPVKFTGAGAPALVERRVTGTSWTNQTAGFTFAVTGSGEWSLTGTPVSGYQYQNGYEYRVTPIRTGSDKLFCSGVSGDPPVAEYTYSFTVGTACPPDINGDGVVDTADLGLLLGNFGGSGLSERGDVNNDGNVDTADLGILLTAFGPCGESFMGGGSGPGAILEELGFESVEDYIKWLDALTHEEQAKHILELLDMLIGG
jgi:hypothetical protein